MERTRQQTFARWGFYLLGMVLLALGLTLNTKTGLGASAIVSVPFTLSQATGWDFGNLTLVVYCLLVAAQFVIKGEKRQWTDLLQIPLSIVFTRFLNVFAALIPYQSGALAADLALLAAAIVFTGAGAAMTVSMQLIPNPGDGIVGTIARVTGRELGCVAVSLLLGFCLGDVLLGVGLGTLLSMVGVGRAIAGFNALCRRPLLAATGMTSR